MRKLIMIVALLVLTSSYAVQVYLPAVNMRSGNGTLIMADISVTQGNGSIFVDVNPLVEPSTQVSVREAAFVACSELNVDCSDYDIYVKFDKSQYAVAGPSAGAMITVAIMSQLHGDALRTDGVMTGTINLDGSVGPVGGIESKVYAAKQAGMRFFIIPEINTAPNITGIEIYTVGDIVSAYKYFTGVDLSTHCALNYSVFNTVMQKSADYLLSNLTYNETDEKIFNAFKEYNLSHYYSASSYAVSAMILDKQNKCMNYTWDEVVKYKSKVVEDYFKLKHDLDSVSGVDSLTDFEILAIAYGRLYEADEMIKEASKAINALNKSAACESLGYADVRLMTVYTWYSMVNRGNLLFDEDELYSSADYALSRAREVCSYAQFLSFLPEKADQLMDQSEELIQSGRYIYSMFKSYQATAICRINMETVGLDNNTLKIKVSNDINVTREKLCKEQRKGIIPIMAMSYLEYAQSFYNNGDYVNAVVYLTYAKEFAYFTEQIAYDLGIIVHIRNKPLIPRSFGIDSYVLYLLLFLLGLGIGVLYRAVRM